MLLTKSILTQRIPINFRESDNSNILSSLPVDPTNNITYYYTYFPGGSFELTAQLTKARDSSINDNGNSTLLYETGTPNHVSSPVVRDSGLILYYNFNEGSGSTAIDRSGHAYNGTLSGPAYTALTSTEQTLYWDASGADYISTPSFAIPDTGVLTMETWMKSTFNTTTIQTIMNGGAGSTTVGYIWLRRDSDSNNLTYQYADGVSSASHTYATFFTSFDNQWIHIVTVCDYQGKKLYWYRNGALLGSSDLTNVPVFPSSNVAKYIGSNYQNNYKLTDGSFDEVRIYNRGLGGGGDCG